MLFLGNLANFQPKLTILAQQFSNFVKFSRIGQAEKILERTLLHR